MEGPALPSGGGYSSTLLSAHDPIIEAYAEPGKAPYTTTSLPHRLAKCALRNTINIVANSSSVMGEIGAFSFSLSARSATSGGAFRLANSDHANGCRSTIATRSEAGDDFGHGRDCATCPGIALTGEVDEVETRRISVAAGRLHYVSGGWMIEVEATIQCQNPTWLYHSTRRMEFWK